MAADVPRPRPAAVGVFDGPRDLSAEVDRHLDETGVRRPLIVVDTSVLLALVNRADAHHEAVVGGSTKYERSTSRLRSPWPRWTIWCVGEAGELQRWNFTET